MRIVSAGTQGKGRGGSVGETRATRWTLRPPRCGDVQPSLAGAAVSGASSGIGSRHSDTRHLPLETPQSTQRSLVGGDCKEERWPFKPGRPEVSPLALDGPLDAAGQGCPAGVHTGLMVISGRGTHGGKLKPRGCTNGVI